MNKKGFVLMETLVVTIFALFIFTVLYNSIVPLLGKYNELAYYDDLDTTYDLYHIKKLIQNDSSFNNIKTNKYKKITCDDLTKKDECHLIYDFLDIPNNGEVIFFNKDYIHSNEIENATDLSSDIKSYLKYINVSDNILLLKKDDYISYLSATVKNVLLVEESGTVYENPDNN